MECDLFVFAGEVSGDLHGGNLLAALKWQRPGLKILGVGGPKMRAQGMDLVMPMEKFQVMGFIDVFLALPKLIWQFYRVRNAILKANPKVVLFIDYPGLNLRLEANLRKKGFQGKICHYICPTVWIWGKKRIDQMAKTLDLLLVILPFEKECFTHTSLKVVYVGHPLIEQIAAYQYKTLLSLENKPAIGLFPGSRQKEIERNLPIYLQVAGKLLEQNPNLVFPILVSHERFIPLISEMLEERNLPKEQFFRVPFERRYDLMRQIQYALAKSGTVTLELALHRIPTVVTYGVTRADQFIIRKILRINLEHYCLVNILCKKTVFPEWMGEAFTFENVYQSMNDFMQGKNVARLQEDLHKLQALLENKKASQTAAREILSLF